MPVRNIPTRNLKRIQSLLWNRLERVADEAELIGRDFAKLARINPPVARQLQAVTTEIVRRRRAH